MRLSSLVHRSLTGVLVTALLGAGLTLSASAASAAPPVAPAGLLTTVTPGLTGYDSLGVNTQTQTDCLSTSSGYSFAMVNTNGMADANGAVIGKSSSYLQYSAAAATGMKIGLFQGYGTAATFWTTTNNGDTRGTAAAVAAKAVKYPANAMIFLNLEATTKATHAQVLTFVKQWIAAVKIRNYLPGIYLGANSGLTAVDLDALTGVAGYWKSPSTSGVPIPARGYVLQQPFSAFEKKLCGVTVDGDVAGTDAKGARLIGAAFPKTIATPTVTGGFMPLSPTRVLDTRSGLGGHRTVARVSSFDLQLAGAGKVIPSGASAVVMNLTVTAPTAGGYVSVYPSGSSNTSSTLNFTANQTVANLATVQLSAGGAVTLFNGSGGSVQLLADVAGYYLGGGTPSVPGTYVPLTPARVLDTRPGGVAAGSRTPLVLAGRGGLPPAATAFSSVVLNATAVTPAQQGYLTVFPAGAAPPNASNLNFTAGQTVPNMVTVMTSASGLSIYNGSAGRANVLADIAGYYLAGNGTATGTFTPTAPTRILDTRTSGKVPATSAISVLVRGAATVPSYASAVVLNVTATDATSVGYIAAFPSDTSAPTASNINLVPGRTIANQVIVPIGADGRVVLLNQSGGTSDLLVDVAGYFTS